MCAVMTQPVGKDNILSYFVSSYLSLTCCFGCHVPRDKSDRLLWPMRIMTPEPTMVRTAVFLLGTVCAVLHFSLPSIFLFQTLTHPQMSFFTLKSAVYYRRDSLSGV